MHANFDPFERRVLTVAVAVGAGRGCGDEASAGYLIDANQRTSPQQNYRPLRLSLLAEAGANSGRTTAWVHCFSAEYPSVSVFVETIRDPVYREAVKHRQAGAEDSRLIRHALLPVGKTSGEIPT
jgi:hypothetical protein